MHRNVDGLSEDICFGACNHIPILRCRFIGMGGDDGGRFDQIVDYIGCFSRSCREGVADIHNHQLRLVLIRDNSLLFRGHPGIP